MPFGQASVRRFMSQVVAHVGEEGAPRGDAPRRLDRFRQREVGRVRTLPQRVEDDDLQVVQQGPAIVGDAAAVGQVGKGAEAETQNPPLAVKHGHRHDLVSVDRQRLLDRDQIELRQPPPRGVDGSKT